MDEFESASNLEELTRQAAIKKVLGQVTAIPLNDTGKCWECGSEVKDNRRWCSAECRDNWDE